MHTHQTRQKISSPKDHEVYHHWKNMVSPDTDRERLEKKRKIREKAAQLLGIVPSSLRKQKKYDRF